MCLAIPGKVVKIEEKSSIVEIMGATREVSTELVSGIEIGDYVLVHAGCAIQKIDEEEALNTIQLFKELKELANDK
ncbi:MAG: HypC/HybG/HupF family hydrogenase formation chaperone [Clostridia bacterium]|nr:HypC/HybG/HupF family hydrogenase formation chaperone [Clostridia bacterium]